MPSDSRVTVHDIQEVFQVSRPRGPSTEYGVYVDACAATPRPARLTLRLSPNAGRVSCFLPSRAASAECPRCDLAGRQLGLKHL
eukprot:4445593-Prymnesium_polylepis.1